MDRKGVVIFTDDEGVFGCFVRGHSDDSMCIPLIDFFAKCEESLETICWIDRVPSASNPADDPSKPPAQSVFCWGGVVFVHSCAPPEGVTQA